MNFLREMTGADSSSIGSRRRVVGGILLLSSLLTALVLSACAVTPSNSTSAAETRPVVAPDSGRSRISAPQSVDGTDDAVGRGGPESVSDNSVPRDISEPEEALVREEEIPRIPRNALAIFPTIKLGSQSDSLPIPGGDVRWSSTSYGVVMYVPEAEHIEIMATTSSKSYSKSYIYGLTISSRLYSVRAGTDVSRQTITELDPRTGNPLGSCSIYSSDVYGEFAIVGDAVFYRSKIRKDLYGNHSGGGQLMTVQFPCSGEATSLQKYGTDANTGRLFGVGDRLVRVARVDDDTYEIREIDKSTGEIERVVDTVFNEYGSFFAGDDALYWREASGVNSSTILRHDLNGAAEEVISLPYSADDMYNIGIDEEDGKVFIVFAEGFDGPRHFYMYDIGNDSLEELPIDPSLFSTYTRGNGQFLFVR